MVGMAYNFVVADRDQQFLMPPDMRDWLPPDHLAWFILDVVGQMDLTEFFASYRADGHGRAAYEPSMLVAILLYAYCIGVRSSRAIEQRCNEDIAFRVLAGNLTPDHVTFARFRQRHEDALARVFIESLRLCAEAGLVSVGTVLLDGTKVAANAAMEASRTLAQIDEEVARILAEAEATDAAEDDRFGGGRGDGLPAELVDPRSRAARLAEAKRRLAERADERERSFQERSKLLNDARAAKGLPPRSYRPRARDEAPQPDARTNVTDPDSRLMRAPGGSVQGYNGQIVCTPQQVIVAAELTTDINDVLQLEPMLDAAGDSLGQAGVEERPDALVADAGYWRAENVNGDNGIELFIPVAKHGRAGKARKDGRASESRTDHLRRAMDAKLATPEGKAMLRLRSATVEPVFGQFKEARGARRFMRRGFDACASEWKLIAATHNLLKLWRHATIA